MLIHWFAFFWCARYALRISATKMILYWHVLKIEAFIVLLHMFDLLRCISVEKVWNSSLKYTNFFCCQRIFNSLISIQVQFQFWMNQMEKCRMVIHKSQKAMVIIRIVLKSYEHLWLAAFCDVLYIKPLRLCSVAINLTVSILPPVLWTRRLFTILKAQKLSYEMNLIGLVLPLVILCYSLQNKYKVKQNNVCSNRSIRIGIKIGMVGTMKHAVVETVQSNSSELNQDAIPVDHRHRTVTVSGDFLHSNWYMTFLIASTQRNRLST